MKIPLVVACFTAFSFGMLLGDWHSDPLRVSLTVINGFGCLLNLGAVWQGIGKGAA